jgi:hypothetical protein
MAELPWFKFIIADWMLDRNLAKCSSATRGVWLELIIAMHQDGRSGELRETVDHLAQLARTSTAVMTQALTELQTTGTADVTYRNTIVTVVNRKMKREAKDRQSTAFRVQKHRSNKNVTSVVTGKSKDKRVKSIDIKAPQSTGEWNCQPGPDLAITLNEIENGGTREWMVHLRQITLSSERIDRYFSAFLLKLTGDKFYASRGDLIQHFRNWLKDQKIETAEVKVDKPTAAPLKKLIPR